jgi:ubiquinone/menaquinone biosynthesis C-methylase UbiE
MTPRPAAGGNVPDPAHQEDDAVMDTKQQREQEFHDKAFAEATRAPLWGIYTIADSSTRAFRDKLLAEGVEGKRVLEFGSGASVQAFFLAQHGAEVVGIDISPVAVEQGREHAIAEGLQERVTFEVMDAEQLEFPDDSFDLVCGSSVIHHLDLSRAYAEMARVLRPGGSAIFLEPLGHNPLINAYRKRTPQYRTADEHPLLLGDLDAAQGHFQAVESEYFHLSSLAAVPLRETRAFPRLVNGLDRVDRGLFRLVPGLRKHAWMVVLRFSEPVPA